MPICSKCSAEIKGKRVKHALPGPSIAAKRKAKRETARERRKRVYAEVDARSGGRCEAADFGGRCQTPASEHDHFWGRGKASESNETVWHLCQVHHLAKTRNDPERVPWLCSYRSHCQRYGYSYQVDRANRSIALEEAQHARSGSPTGGDARGRKEGT